MRTSVLPFTAVMASLAIGTTLSNANAQTAPASPSGPPADAKALVAAPTDTIDAPKIEKPTDGTSASIAAGGLMTTGNSYMLAGTANGAYERRFGDNSVGGAVIANYGESRPPGGENRATAQNIQAKLRYDRFLTENTTAFLMATGRSDRFQGIEFRLNIDPGVKYLFVNQPTAALWGEAGYDFQYDVRRDDARFNSDGTPVSTPVPDKDVTSHSTRLFVGTKYAFNSDVTFKAGVEYLQSIVNSEYDSNSDRWRLNFDALVAAKLRGGLALGVGFGAHFDHAPLPGKEQLDTSTNLSLIYSFADPAPKKDDCPVIIDPNAPPPPPPSSPEGGAPMTAPASANPPPPAPMSANPPPPAPMSANPPAPAPAPEGQR